MHTRVPDASRNPRYPLARLSPAKDESTILSRRNAGDTWNGDGAVQGHCWSPTAIRPLRLGRRR